MTKKESKRLIEFLNRHKHDAVGVEITLYPDKYTRELWFRVHNSNFTGEMRKAPVIHAGDISALPNLFGSNGLTITTSARK